MRSIPLIILVILVSLAALYGGTMMLVGSMYVVSDGGVTTSLFIIWFGILAPVALILFLAWRWWKSRQSNRHGREG